MTPFIRIASMVAMAMVTLSECSVARPQNVLWQRDADEQSMLYGDDLALSPDRNGDGIDDVLLGYTGKNCNSWSGMLYLLSGADGSDVFSICGGDPNGGCAFGDSVATLPDLDLDGVPEFAVGDGIYDDSSTGNTWAGGAFIYSGATQLLLTEWVGEDQDNRFGSVVRTISDLDGDGFEDLIVSAPRYSWYVPLAQGRVYVYSSVTGALLRTHDGEKDLDNFGRTVVRIHDLDGDGVDEFAVNSVFAAKRSPGQVELFSGASGSLIRTWTGDHDGANLGGAMADVGDLNGDGFHDLLATAAGLASESGSAYCYSGKDGSELFALQGARIDDKFGSACANVGDVNGDGTPDFVIGAFFDDHDGKYSGSATLFSGKTARALYTFFPGYVNAIFGGIVAGGSDFNGDRIPDFLIGAGQTPPILGKRMGGRVTAYAGNDLYLQAQEREVSPNDSVTLDTRGGESGALALLVLIDISGTPTFAPLQLSTLDVFGESAFTAVVPSAASGLEFTLIAFAQKGVGRPGVIDSWTEVVLVQ